MKNVSNYADLLVNVHNLLTFPSNSVELRIFNIYGNRYTGTLFENTILKLGVMMGQVYESMK